MLALPSQRTGASVCGRETEKAQGGCDFFFSLFLPFFFFLVRLRIVCGSDQAVNQQPSLSHVENNLHHLFSIRCPPSASVFGFLVCGASKPPPPSLCVRESLLCKCRFFERRLPTCLGLLSEEDARYCHVPAFKVCSQRRSWRKPLMRR